MKILFFSLTLMLLVATPLRVNAAPEEKFPTLKIGDIVYTNVTVTDVSETEIFFFHSRGMGNAKLKSLEPALQQHFHYDTNKAAAQEQARKEATAKLFVGVPTVTNKPPAVQRARADMMEALAKVAAIVNQPPTQVKPRDGMNTGNYKTWFHDGAIRPDFANVDIRKTRETNYAQSEYVTGDLCPGLVFLGNDLEFNSMTKFFYINRNLPKKKLTEEEMVEINRLYRVIGQSEAALTKAGVKVEWK